MKTVQNAMKRIYILSLVLSIAFVGGIPLIIFGAINQWWILMALGIVCVVCGFYGSPIAWINYGGIRNLKRLVLAIVEEHIYTIKDLALQLSISEKEARNRLNKCFQKGYLYGYRREGDNIILNEGLALEKRKLSSECPNCGAKFFYDSENPCCTYCNSPIK